MKVLLDENLPHELRGLLAPHDVFTVAFLQWSGVRNGDLMRRAQAEAFDCILTFDKGFGHQKPAGVSLKVIFLQITPRNMQGLQQNLPELLVAIETGESSREVHVL